ncbi:MAG TPA: hypothetical protein VL992_04765 [Tepidisphaeraceae bacterium]|nr:hypothetical protein [Tepidisphaeraceae bacterium]
MSSLREIEAAVDSLLPDQRQELLIYIAAKMRADRSAIPQPRDFTGQQINTWIQEDESDMRRFRDGK